MTSLSHSQANQGAPVRENENRSCVGTAWCARMYWPVRMCQPVSPSPNSVFHPPVVKMNSQLTSAIKKQSEIEGTRGRGIFATALSANPEASGETGVAGVT